jgi:hypothetical protein
VIRSVFALHSLSIRSRFFALLSIRSRFALHSLPIRSRVVQDSHSICCRFAPDSLSSGSRFARIHLFFHSRSTVCRIRPDSLRSAPDSHLIVSGFALDSLWLCSQFTLDSLWIPLDSISICSEISHDSSSIGSGSNSIRCRFALQSVLDSLRIHPGFALESRFNLDSLSLGLGSLSIGSRYHPNRQRIALGLVSSDLDSVLIRSRFALGLPSIRSLGSQLAPDSLSTR